MRLWQLITASFALNFSEQTMLQNLKRLQTSKKQVGRKTALEEMIEKVETLEETIAEIEAVKARIDELPADENMGET